MQETVWFNEWCNFWLSEIVDREWKCAGKVLQPLTGTLNEGFISFNRPSSLRQIYIIQGGAGEGKEVGGNQSALFFIYLQIVILQGRLYTNRTLRAVLCDVCGWCRTLFSCGVNYTATDIYTHTHIDRVVEWWHKYETRATEDVVPLNPVIQEEEVGGGGGARELSYNKQISHVLYYTFNNCSRERCVWYWIKWGKYLIGKRLELSNYLRLTI